MARKPVNTTVDEALWDELRIQAIREKMEIREMLEKVIKEYLVRHQK